MTAKFFTNEEGNTLLEKFEGMFRHMDVHYFDALVGFFRASGYFRIRPFLDDVTRVRVIIGISTDSLVAKAAQHGLLFTSNGEEARAEMIKTFVQDIQSCNYEQKVEEGIRQMFEDLMTGKLEIRIHPSKNIHAKLYIARQAEKHAHAGWGAAITGSSNLTDAGLSNNFELNVELRDHAEVEAALDIFERLWLESIPVDESFGESIKGKIFLETEVTPFEVFMRMLIEHFADQLDLDVADAGDLPAGFMRLTYQIEAVKDGFHRLLRHNGFFLSDVVGLGKTVVAIMIARRFAAWNGIHTRILIITPPHLEESWNKMVRKFHLPGVDLITNGSLHKLQTGSYSPMEDYDLIIVDEAHKFRRDTAQMYDLLQKLCKTPRVRPGQLDDGREKKIILVSATPLNNHPEDLRNLILLFQDPNDSTLEIGNIKAFFRPLIDRYNDLRKDKKKFDKNTLHEVKAIFETIRIKLLAELVIRRTRSDLEAVPEYKADLIKQGITFPKISKPIPIIYELDRDTEELFDDTIKILSNRLKYERYKAIARLKKNVKDDNPRFNNSTRVADQLASLMRTGLVKRLDSSFHAFGKSIGRYQSANRAMIKMLDDGRFFLVPDVDVTNFILQGEEDKLLELLTKTDAFEAEQIVFSPEDFVADFRVRLVEDQALLDELADRWALVSNDPKLDRFVQMLDDELMKPAINLEGKLVVFSESKDTTLYLDTALKARLPNHRILTVDSSTRKERMPQVLANFDANQPQENRKWEYDIILTTEVLAEGVNLHRANVILNYDTPWNSTRLMQRIGRVNRIGTKAKEIYIYNFYPSAKVDNDIDLKKRAIMKLQAFHAALGEDSQIYSDEEEFETFGLFDRAPEEDRDRTLDYRDMVRTFRREQPDEFRRLLKLPQRIRVGRQMKVIRGATISYLRTRKREGFFLAKADGSLEELSFLECADLMRCHPKERAIPLHAEHHAQVKLAVDQFYAEGLTLAASHIKLPINQSLAERNLIQLLDALTKSQEAMPDEVTILKEGIAAISAGRFSTLPRQLKKAYKAVEHATFARKIEALVQELKKFPLRSDQEARHSKIKLEHAQPEIILSESFDAH